MDKGSIIAIVVAAIVMVASASYVFSVENVDDGYPIELYMASANITDMTYDNPSSYDLRDHGLVTPVRDQGSFGTCWAHSTIACIENSLIRNGYAGTDVDLSEAWLAHTVDALSYDDPRISGDRLVNGDILTLGGTDQTAALIASCGVGLTDESVVPYSVLDDGSFPDSVENRYVVTGTTLINSMDLDAIKHMISEGYALSLNYTVDMKYYTISESDSDDRIVSVYVDDRNAQANHLVTVIGYDDAYPASNFKSQPPADGAWLIKNSWGTDVPLVDSTGCFWLSYWSYGVGSLIAVDAAPVNEVEDNIYMYDGGVSLNQDITFGNYGAMANVFVSDGDETLTAVSFVLNSNTGVDYTVRVFKGMTDDKDPSSGECVLTQSGRADFAGMVRVDLDKGIVLGEGERFSVVVDLYVQGSYVYLAVDTSSDMYDPTDLKQVWGENRTTAHAGESFIGSDGVQWMDLGSDGMSNIRIKAYTEDN